MHAQVVSPFVLNLASCTLDELAFFIWILEAFYSMSDLNAYPFFFLEYRIWHVWKFGTDLSGRGWKSKISFVPNAVGGALGVPCCWERLVLPWILKCSGDRFLRWNCRGVLLRKELCRFKWKKLQSLRKCYGTMLCKSGVWTEGKCPL